MHLHFKKIVKLNDAHQQSMLNITSNKGNFIPAGSSNDQLDY